MKSMRRHGQLGTALPEREIRRATGLAETRPMENAGRNIGSDSAQMTHCCIAK
jgi:hypothetical protein